ncbi:SH3-containing GRB2-like protein 3-interacting protein 1 [Saguinus oedipus]|uniref:SH3-containing GRB2-like protein 3-interacting protein 1 n=1 Tax=Saguinus oedipus TaxID=9490 RepID=A0ABQ9VFS4_SAGOE|nr:SH3-containing GRB2-like protein 3-interacting protein 1 [Saguinus oedipus]
MKSTPMPSVACTKNSSLGMTISDVQPRNDLGNIYKTNAFESCLKRRSPGAIKRNLSSEEVARPRRSTPTPELISKKPPDDTMALAPLFGPPLESAFDEQKTEERRREIRQLLEAPPPLPPKNVPATPPRTGSPLTIGPGNDQSATEVKIEKLPSINDLDSIFGPVLSPKSVAVNAEEKWVHFSDTSPEHVTPELTPREKVVSPPATPDNPADSPAPGPPGHPGPTGPPGPPGPPRNVPSPLNLEEVQKKVAEQTFIKDDYLETISSPKDFGLGQRATPPPPPPPTYRTVVSSPGPGSGPGTGTTSAGFRASTLTPLVWVPCGPTACPSSSDARSHGPSLWMCSALHSQPLGPHPRKRKTIQNQQVFLPCIIPCSTSHSFGSLQQYHSASTPSPASIPTKATSRKAWSWRCGMFPSALACSETSRPFSPPIHSSSPPPIAPLARAESTSSISSTNSLSAATTPTVVSEDDVFYDKLPSFERRCETPAGTVPAKRPLET